MDSRSFGDILQGLSRQCQRARQALGSSSPAWRPPRPSGRTSTARIISACEAARSRLLAGFAADNSTLEPKMLDSVTVPLSAAAGTPIGPVATSIGDAIGRTAGRRFNAGGQIRVVNSRAAARRGSRARISNGPNGAHATISGGSGVTYLLAKVRASDRRHDRHGRRRASGRARSRISHVEAGAPIERRC